MANLLWLQSGGCGGCSMSLLGAEGPDLMTTLETAGIHLLWHPSLSEQSGTEVRALLQSIVDGETELDMLCIEGSLMRGPNGTGRFHLLGGTGIPMIHWVEKLAQRARYTLAIGSCAAYGGITSAGDNIGEATGLQFEGELRGGLLGSEYRSSADLPVVNVAGCPVHPNWVTETLIELTPSPGPVCMRTNWYTTAVPAMNTTNTRPVPNTRESRAA